MSIEDIQILEVKNRKDFKRFVRFQNWLYRGNKFFVPALELDELKLFSPKNPSCPEVEFKAFMALRKGQIVGRIAAIVHKTYNELNNCKNVRFTRFDLIDDCFVARALLDAVCNFAREQGMEAIHGPLGFNDLDKEGVLIEGFDKVGTFANFYNYAYYKSHLEDAGFEKEIDWLEFVVPMIKELDPRFIKIAERMKERLGLSVVSPKMSKSKVVKRYGNQIFKVINDNYAGLHGVIPITDAVRDDVLKQFSTIIRREHVHVVVDKNDQVVGFGLTAPNISRSLNASGGRLLNFGFLPINALRIKLESMRPKYVDMCLVAVKPEYRGKGVNVIIIHEIFKALVNTRVRSLESNLQLETNLAIQAELDPFNKKLIKKRRCYKKILSSEVV
jgi:ribosomal protein S18 acetylase RimI-like enzyme